MVICNVQQVLDAKLPGYTPFIWLLNELGFVREEEEFLWPSREGEKFTSFLGNAGDVDVERRLLELISSSAFREVLFQCHTYAIAATQALFAEDFLCFLENHQVTEKVLFSLPDYFPFLLDNVAPTYDGHFRGISTLQDGRARELLDHYPFRELSDSLASIPKSSCFIQDGCVIIPLDWKCPLPEGAPFDGAVPGPLLLAHGLSWACAKSVFDTRHLVRAGEDGRPAHNRFGVYVGSAAVALSYAEISEALGTRVQVAFIVRASQALPVAQLSDRLGTQYVLRENWFDVAYLLIRPVHPGYKPSGMERSTRVAPPADWSSYNLDHWGPLGHKPAPICSKRDASGGGSVLQDPKVRKKFQPVVVHQRPSQTLESSDLEPRPAQESGPATTHTCHLL